MVGKFVCPDRSRLRSARFYHVVSERARGTTTIWPVTRRGALDPQLYLCALTAYQKSLCTAFGGLKRIRQYGRSRNRNQKNRRESSTWPAKKIAQPTAISIAVKDTRGWQASSGKSDSGS